MECRDLNYSFLHLCDTMWRRQPDEEEIENSGTNFNEEAHMRIRWLLITDTKQAVGKTSRCQYVCVSVSTPFANEGQKKTGKKRPAAAAEL